MKLTITIALLMLLVLAGCQGGRSVQRSTVVHDTTYVDVVRVERDTLLVTERAGVDISFDCDSLMKALSEAGTKRVQKQFKNASITISAGRDGRLTADCDCDTLSIEAKLRDTIRREFRNRSETTTIRVPVKYVPGWVKLFAYIGGAVSAGVLGILTFQLIKLIS